jgi:peroxiredoxin
LRSFQRQLGEFTSRGVHVAAISVDSTDINRRQCSKIGYTFSVLSDANAGVIRRYDLLHRGAGPKGNDISRPAEFFVDSTGTVQWVNLTDNIAVRTRPEQVIRAIDALRGGSRD